MANSRTHAVSSARRFGGIPEEFQAIHDWFDETKAHWADTRHRALRHHSLGIFECEQRFGTHIILGTGKEVPVRLIAEQHVIEDCGFIPSLQDWFENIQYKDWMLKGAQPLSKVLERTEGVEGLRPLPVLTDARCDELISSLDEIARDYDSHEYGLPWISDDFKEKMRTAVRTWLTGGV